MTDIGDQSTRKRPAAEPWSTVELARRDGEDGETLPEQIAERISGLIAAGRLAAGDRLPSERDLAQIFGVNRLAVREAAHRLEARGLVVVRRGAGSFVAPSPLEQPEPAERPVRLAFDLDDLIEVGMVLEPTGADWAARRAERGSVAVLRRIAEQFEETLATGDPQYDVLAAADTNFHLEIARCAENAVLSGLVEQLYGADRFPLEWSLRPAERPQETAAEHRRIVEAVAVGDPAAAREAMAAHLAATAAALRRLAEGEPTPD